MTHISKTEPAAKSPAPDSKVIEDALKDFKRSVEITRDVRFQANLRLGKRQRASSYIVSLLSLYVIALSLLPNIIALQFQSQILLACSIVLSVFIIFTSLIDSSQNFYHRGELLHQCARKVATIHHALKNIDVAADPEHAREELDKLQRDYRLALDECPTNHDNVDFYKEKASKPHLFPVDYAARSKALIRNWNRFRVLFLSNLWMSIHVVAFIVITIIVCKLVLSGAQWVK